MLDTADDAAVTFTVTTLFLGGPAVYAVTVDSVIVAGPFHTKNQALAEANLLASAEPGNRVES